MKPPAPRHNTGELGEWKFDPPQIGERPKKERLATHLSKDVADEWFVQDGAAIYELEQVHTGSMLLHDHHKEVGRFVEVQHLNNNNNF